MKKLITKLVVCSLIVILSITATIMIYRHYMKTIEIEAKLKSVQTYNTDIIYWGDSLTAGAGGDGITYPKVCSQILNKSFLNMGVGGETSYTILARMGVITPIIPANADCSSLVLKDINGNDIKPLLQGSIGVNPIHIDNDKTDYILSLNKDNTYSIRDSNGTILHSTNYPRFIEMNGANTNGAITVIFVGQNDSSRNQTLINRLKQAVNKVQNKRFVIIGLTTGTTESRKSLNDIMYAEFGNKFFDAGYYVSKFGMNITNMLPTIADENAINEGSIPSSLLVDHVHMNANGYTALGTLLAHFIENLYQ